MNTWLLIRRLRGPAFLVLVGITALLNQWGVLGFARSWPLYLILAGVLGLAERAAMAAAPPIVPPLYPGAYGPAGYSPSGYGGAPPYTGLMPQSAPPIPSGPPSGPSIVSGSPADDPFADPNRRS
jgi:hypothetical protein